MLVIDEYAIESTEEHANAVQQFGRVRAHEGERFTRKVFDHPRGSGAPVLIGDFNNLLAVQRGPHAREAKPLLVAGKEVEDFILAIEKSALLPDLRDLEHELAIRGAQAKVLIALAG